MATSTAAKKLNPNIELVALVNTVDHGGSSAKDGRVTNLRFQAQALIDCHCTGSQAEPRHPTYPRCHAGAGGPSSRLGADGLCTFGLLPNADAGNGNRQTRFF